MNPAGDIAAIERLTERVLHPGSTVRKKVEHDERGRITQVIEIHEPFTVASQAREFSELVERLNRTPLTQVQWPMSREMSCSRQVRRCASGP